MTEPSLILPSAVLPKSLHNLPSAFVHPKEVTLKVTGLSDYFNHLLNIKEHSSECSFFATVVFISSAVH